MRILWIEDKYDDHKQALWFDNISNCKIEVIRDYVQAKEHILKKMHQFDLAVLDIDLEGSAPSDEIAKIARQFELDTSSFLQEAGFHLYIQLLEQGYDKNRVIFFTGNASGTERLPFYIWAFRQVYNEKPSTAEEKLSRKKRFNELFNTNIRDLVSDIEFKELETRFTNNNPKYFWEYLDQLADERGSRVEIKNTYETLKRRFKDARMSASHAVCKGSDKQIQSDLQTWLYPHLNNSYLRLRDALVSMAEFIEDNLHDDDQILFNKYIPDTERQFSQADLRAYFLQLAALLPQREPTDENKQRVYQQLLRALVHEWDDKAKDARWPDAALASILRQLRNWLAHGKTPSTITEPLLAYLFWLNCRTMFNFSSDELQPLEHPLLLLFRHQGTDDLHLAKEATQIVNKRKADLKQLIKNFNDQRPASEINYSSYKDKRGIEKQIKTFGDLAVNAHRNAEFQEQHNQWLWDAIYTLFWESCKNSLAELNPESLHYLNAMARCFWQISQSCDDA